MLFLFCFISKVKYIDEFSFFTLNTIEQIPQKRNNSVAQNSAQKALDCWSVQKRSKNFLLLPGWTNQNGKLRKAKRNRQGQLRSCMACQSQERKEKRKFFWCYCYFNTFLLALVGLCPTNNILSIKNPHVIEIGIFHSLDILCVNVSI